MYVSQVFLLLQPLLKDFFSICGVVCKQRAGNSSDDLLITRSFLKCNIEILNEMNNF